MAATNAERQKAYRSRRNVTEPILRNVTPDLLAKVDAWAARQGLDQSAAIAQLIARGLIAAEGPRLVANAVCNAAEETSRGGINVASMGLQLGPTPRKPGSMLKKGRG